MQKSGLFTLLFNDKKGLTLVRKPEKIYLENTNLFSLIEETKGFCVERGSIRETFFLNQMLAVTGMYYTNKADFVDLKGTHYEIGGKNKKVNPPNIKQLQSGNYYLIRDDILTGHKNTIPLWLFGFLY